MESLKEPEMRMAPDPMLPEVPGDKWHKEKFEDSLKPKPKAKSSAVVRDDTIPDDTGDDSRDDSGWN